MTFLYFKKVVLFFTFKEKLLQFLKHSKNVLNMKLFGKCICFDIKLLEIFKRLLFFVN